MTTPRVTSVERITLDVPFRPRVEPWNRLLVRQWRIVEAVILHTDAPGIVGYGETLPYYTWGKVTEAAVARVTGRPLSELTGDDTLGAGLQMAVYDALGKALDVPVWRLFGLPQVRDRAPLAWWNTDMPPDVLAEEAQEAVASGYLRHKIKPRPWFDVWAQIEQVSEVTPSTYGIEPDFNDMLLDAGRAVKVLTDLDNYPKIALYEGPIPQRDVAGYRRLRQHVRRPIAMHYGLPPFATAARSEICDGFVLNQGITATLAQAQVLEAFDMPFFLQFVGTGLTTALTAHLGAVLPMARWPAVTCLNNYADDLITRPLTIRGGQVTVPDGPGLGIEPDSDAFARFRMQPPYSVPLGPHLITVAWPDGRRAHYPYMTRPTRGDAPPFSHLQFARGAQATSALLPEGPGLWEDALMGNLPGYERGVELSVRHEDGSADFADLYGRALTAPVWE